MSIVFQGVGHVSLVRKVVSFACRFSVVNMIFIDMSCFYRERDIRGRRDFVFFRLRCVLTSGGVMIFTNLSFFCCRYGLP